MNKSTFIWISIFALWFMFLGSATTNTEESSLAVLFGEFIGSFLFIYTCVWITSKVKRIFKKSEKPV